MGLLNKVILYTQPANSPDLNINDLGLFRALQSAYLHFTPTKPEEIIQYVQQVHRDYPGRKINRIWLTLQSVMNQIIDAHGDNDFYIPHMQNAKLECEN